MPVRPARAAHSASTFVIAASLFGALAWACDLGLDVDALSRGCPECRDATPETASTEAGTADASSEADARDAADTDGARCPIAVGGPMDPTSGFCMDRDEVTNERYAEFLASGFRLDGGAAGACDPSGSYVPTGAWPAPATKSAHPVTHVTWCAARAFCAWAGKRLCGARSGAGVGGPLDVALIGRHELDEWTAACSQDGKVAYVYGNDFVATACNGDAFNVRDTLPTGSLATCAPVDGGVPHDLSGNVWEWIDACDSEGFCFAHGGGFNSPAPELVCTSRLRGARDAGLDTVGFRCCAR